LTGTKAVREQQQKFTSDVISNSNRHITAIRRTTARPSS